MQIIPRSASQSLTKLSPYSPFMLLIATGGLLGISVPLAKIAQFEDLTASLFLSASVALAALFLGIVGWLRGHSFETDREHVRYYFIAALVSVALPNQLLFWSIPHVGSGYAALSLALPPLFTYLGAVAFKLERFNILRAAGVIFALMGAMWLAWHKFHTSSSEQTLWLGLLVLVPISLAIGNIFRTKFWPAGAKSDQLAPGMMIAAALLLAPIAIAETLDGNELSWLAMGLILGQGAILSWQYLFFFELQARGGPVLLSLIGSVAAVVAVPISVLFLNESWPSGLILGTGLIILGISLVLMRRNAADPDEKIE